MVGLPTYSITLLAVCPLLLALATDPIQLSLSPSGVLKKGDTFTLSCTVSKFENFDIVRIIRSIKNPKTGLDQSVTLATNGHLSNIFEEVPRYSATSDFKTKTFTLTVSDAQGEDGGSLGCAFAGSSNSMSEQTAEEFVNVFVPVDTVQIRSKASDGQWIPLEDGGEVVLRDGFEEGVECYVEVSGSDKDIKPKVTFKIGNEDMTKHSSVEHDSEYIATIENNQLSRTFRTWYKMETSSPDKAFNGMNIECTASMREHEPVSITAQLSVEYAPEVECRETTFATMGQENVRVTCNAEMNPAPTTSFWSWGTENATMLNTGDLHNGFSAEQTQLEGNSWEFSLVVAEVDETYLQEYSFSVENGLGGPVKKSATLGEVEETPEPEPKTTEATKPEPKPKTEAPESDPKMNEVIGEEDKSRSSVTAGSILLCSVAALLSALRL